ncbi:MAG: hypothetical protein K2J20_06055 [Bacilli bacterium]|nr:hypothetical protein [Bacilli bacterium]
MKESIGGISLFAIVIAFVLLFTAYICFSINYSKAYNIKNEIVNIIRNQGGVCTDINNTQSICYNFAEQIEDYFKEMNYRTTGKCDDGWVGYSRTGEVIYDGKNAAFCVNAVSVIANSELPNALYYQVKVFYQLDLPVVNNVFQLSVVGETARIYEPNECAYDTRYDWCH